MVRPIVAAFAALTMADALAEQPIRESVPISIEGGRPVPHSPWTTTHAADEGLPSAILADCNGNSVTDDTEFLSGVNVNYQLDDNTFEGNLGWGGTGGGDRALNEFTVSAGGEYLVEITVTGANHTVGERIPVLVYADPNGDGNPNDAILLRETSVRYAGGTLITVPLSPPVYLGEAGSRFFLGKGISTNSLRPCLLIDASTTALNRSWWQNNRDAAWEQTSNLSTMNGDGTAGVLGVRGRAQGRAVGVTDCNGNGVLDDCDLSCTAPFVKEINKVRTDGVRTEAVFQVLFSEPVTGVDAADFSFSPTGSVAPGAATSVTAQGGGASYIVSFSTVQGVGTVALDVLNNGSIRDIDNNALAGGTLLGTTRYDVDGRRAEVVSAIRLDPNPVTGGNPRYQYTFSRPVHRFGFTMANYLSTTATIGTVTPGLTGSGTALGLPGTASQHATVPTNSLFNGDFTIETWVYPRAFNAWSRIIDFGNGTNNGNVLIALTSSTSGLPYFDVRNGGTIAGSVNSPRQLPLNSWSHIAAVKSGNTLQLYINGFLEAQNNLTAPLTPVARTSNFIGRSNWAADPYMNAIVDDLRIWSTARTRQQIVDSMHTPPSGPTAGLSAHWQFNEGTGSLAADSSGNGLDATLVNTPVWEANNGLGGSVVTVQANLAGGDGLFVPVISPDGVFASSGVPSAPYNPPTYYNYDQTAPTVVSATRRDPNPTNASEVSWNLQFSEPVVGLSQTDLFTTETMSLTPGSIMGSAGAPSVSAAFGRANSTVTVPGLGDDLDDGEITVEFWARVSAAVTQTTFALVPDVSANRFLAHVIWSDGRVYWDYGNIGVGGRVSAPTTGVPGVWRHFALTRSTANNRMRIYLDGVQIGTKTGVSPLVGNGRDFAIGGFASSYWGGSMHDFRIWTRELTPAEIIANRDRSIAEPEADLLLCFPFTGAEDLGVGAPGTNDTRDYSGNGNHGDISSNTYLIPYGNSAVVTAATGSGTGEMGLHLTDNDFVTDIAGRPLGGPGFGNGNFSGSEAYFVDKDAPATTLAGPATKVEGQIVATLADDDFGGTGVTTSTLYLRRSDTDWAEHAPDALTSTTLAFTPSGDGIFHYVVVAEDALGNRDAAPVFQDAVANEQVTIYNDVTNSPFVHLVPAGGPRTLVFPMEEPGINLSLSLPTVTSGGRLSASRTESNAGAASAGLNTALLIGESWAINGNPEPGFTGGASAVFAYEEALLNGVNENAGITGAFAYDGALTIYTGADVSVDAGQNLIQVTSINGFSDWYFGAANASAREWTVLE